MAQTRIVQHVGVAAAVQDVAAVGAEDRVVARATIDGIHAAMAGQDVVMRRTVQVFDAVEGVDAVVTVDAGTAAGDAGGDAVGGLCIISRIVA